MKEGYSILGYPSFFMPFLYRISSLSQQALPKSVKENEQNSKISFYSAYGTGTIIFTLYIIRKAVV